MWCVYWSDQFSSIQCVQLDDDDEKNEKSRKTLGRAHPVGWMHQWIQLMVTLNSLILSLYNLEFSS